MTVLPMRFNPGWSAVTESLPMFCPATLTPLVQTLAFLHEVQVSLPSTATGPVVVTLQDGQTPPVPAFSVSLNPGDVLGFIFNGRTMSGGIWAKASIPDAASIYVRWFGGQI